MTSKLQLIRRSIRRTSKLQLNTKERQSLQGLSASEKKEGLLLISREK